MKTFVILIAISLFSGCALIQKEVPVVEYRSKQPPKFPSPEPVKLKPVIWYVITKDKDTGVIYVNHNGDKNTIHDFMLILEDKDNSPSLFGITPEGYVNMSTNTEKMKQWMIQKNIQHDSTTEYYDK